MEGGRREQEKQQRMEKQRQKGEKTYHVRTDLELSGVWCRRHRDDGVLLDSECVEVRASVIRKALEVGISVLGEGNVRCPFRLHVPTSFP